MRRLLLAALLTLPVAAQIPEVNGVPKQAFALRWLDVAEGTGASAKAGQKYIVHYTGWLTNGKKFDSSVDRNTPFEFVQGRRAVIAGWEAGFEGMKVGGKRRLFIPYQMAYGEKGSGANIPPRSELIFDVELLDVKDVPDVPAAADLMMTLDEQADKILKLARAVPEEKYNWKPGKDVRSFGQVFLHIAYGNKLLLTIANQNPPQEELGKMIAANEAGEAAAHSKAEILKLLEDSFAEVRKSMEKERAGALGRDTMFFGTPTTRRGVLVSLDAHASEHLGQAIAYARMNGIVPPWSK